MRLLDAKSGFRDDPWARLERTTTYVGVLSFGIVGARWTPPQRECARYIATWGSTIRSNWRGCMLAWSTRSCPRPGPVASGSTQASATRYVAGAGGRRRVGRRGARIERAAHDEARARCVHRPRSNRGWPPPREAREAARYVVVPPRPPVPRRFVVPARLGWTGVTTLAVGLLPTLGAMDVPAAARARAPRWPPAVGMRALRQAVRALPEQYREGPLYREAKCARALTLAELA